MSDTTTISAITSAIRNINRNATRRLNDAKSANRSGMYHPAATYHNILGEMVSELDELVRTIPARTPEAFASVNLTAFGYNTVLGYLNEEDHLSLQMMEDPVRSTIKMGHKATALCLSRGLKVVRVPACKHITERYAKVTHVNAYPIAVLAEAIYGCKKA